MQHGNVKLKGVTLSGLGSGLTLYCLFWPWRIKPWNPDLHFHYKIYHARLSHTACKIDSLEYSQGNGDVLRRWPTCQYSLVSFKWACIVLRLVSCLCRKSWEKGIFKSLSSALSNFVASYTTFTPKSVCIYANILNKSGNNHNLTSTNVITTRLKRTRDQILIIYLHILHKSQMLASTSVFSGQSERVRGDWICVC